MTFTRTLEGGVIRWDGDTPPPGEPVRVTATVAGPLVLPRNGPQLAAILDELAALPADQRFTLEQWEADRADEEPAETRWVR